MIVSGSICQLPAISSPGTPSMLPVSHCLSCCVSHYLQSYLRSTVLTCTAGVCFGGTKACFFCAEHLPASPPAVLSQLRSSVLCKCCSSHRTSSLPFSLTPDLWEARGLQLQAGLRMKGKPQIYTIYIIFCLPCLDVTSVF